MGLSNGILTAPFTKIAANGQGDLQQALNRSETSHILLISDVDENNTPLNPSRINKYARFKSFQHSTVTFPTFAAHLAALQEKYYGLSFTEYSTAALLHSGWATEWGYDIPRLTQSTQWPLRAFDFRGYATRDRLMAEWVLGEKSVVGDAITFGAPLGCLLSMRSKTLGNGDVIGLTMQKADPDISGGVPQSYDAVGTGLLYVSDLARSDSSYGSNYSTWHIGIALISTTNSNNDRYWVSSAALNTNLEDDVDATISITSNVPNDTYVVVPILAYGHTSDGWLSPSGFGSTLVRVITLDGYGLTGFTKSSSASGFTVLVGDVYTSGNDSKVNVKFVNNSASSISLSTVFTYIEADAIYDTDQEHAAVESGVQAWVSAGTKYTAGIKYNNVVVAAYKAQSAITVPADSQVHEYALTLANSTTDASGNEYDDRAHVYLCVQQGSEKKVYE